MKSIWRIVAAALAFGAITFPAGAAVAPPAAQRTSADARLKALYDGYAAWEDKEFGSFENSRGERERAGYLPHVDEATQLRRAAHLKDLLAQLDSIPTSQLSPDEQVNAAVFRTVLEADIADAQFRTWEMPFNSDSEGYHETITRVFLRGVRLFLKEADNGEPIHLLVNELLLSPMGRRDWPLRFYSRDLLLSVEARRKFVAPDIAALP